MAMTAVNEDCKNSIQKDFDMGTWKLFCLLLPNCTMQLTHIITGSLSAYLQFSRGFQMRTAANFSHVTISNLKKFQGIAFLLKHKKRNIKNEFSCAIIGNRTTSSSYFWFFISYVCLELKVTLYFLLLKNGQTLWSKGLIIS